MKMKKDLQDSGQHSAFLQTRETLSQGLAKAREFDDETLAARFNIFPDTGQRVKPDPRPGAMKLDVQPPCCFGEQVDILTIALRLKEGKGLHPVLEPLREKIKKSYIAYRTFELAARHIIIQEGDLEALFGDFIDGQIKAVRQSESLARPTFKA